ncbi:hypothetical protein [Microbacterium thalli]|uniref:Uncharacterized protein n=1 Tax=Microbacterium thalli TaxID=3027921 RepID=A0ABT5SF03_9MICO|nr:hypothetical protein [Microbacterium thalli]MDD7961394.1 hypothetical protein [Microbacterium thalli]
MTSSDVSADCAAVTPDRMRKAKQKMTALADAIGRFHVTRSKVGADLNSGSTLEIHNSDPLVNAIDDALVAIRTLDLEIFEASNSAVYVGKRGASSCGMTVRGLTAPRNTAVHGSEVIDPDIDRAVGPVAHNQYIVWPIWKDRSDIPHAAFAKTSAGALQAYDSNVAGRPVLDTLMDAFRFFTDYDPCLAEGGSAGQAYGFPLPALAVSGYERLHPDWPDHAEAEVRIRKEAQSTRPGGVRRKVEAILEVDGQTVVAGYTVADSVSIAFTEPISQVLKDVQGGYRYEIVGDSGDITIDVRSDQLSAGGRSLEEAVGVPTGIAATAPWEEWWRLCVEDAAYYRAQRQPER